MRGVEKSFKSNELGREEERRIEKKNRKNGEKEEKLSPREEEERVKMTKCDRKRRREEITNSHINCSFIPSSLHLSV